ncbi:MAG: PD40 domain-containing protein, partial [Pelolinea sp.]|nr:PD40 domain-containing protein [Pelolinea sp.]
SILTDFTGTVHSPAWSPDGSYLAFILDQDGISRVLVTEPSSGEFFLVHEAFEKYAGLSWSE